MRNLWVDYAKGVGIILVVYGHVARGVYNAKIPLDAFVFSTVDSVIYTFHMPLFFFLSGLFFYESLAKRKWAGFIAGKIDSIVYPYIVWSILQGSLEVALGHFTNGNVTIQDVLSLIWHPRAQFWFLYSLFQVLVLASALYFKRNKYYFFGISVLASTGYLLEIGYGRFIIVTAILPNFCFFSFGVLYREVGEVLFRHRNKLLLPLLAACLWGQWYFHVVLDVTHTSSGMSKLLLATASILCVCTFCQVISVMNIPVLSALGRGSMVIYLAHVLAAAAVRILLQTFLGVQSPSVHLALGVIAGLGGPLVLNAIGGRLGLGFLFAVPPALSVERAYLSRSAGKGL